VILLKLLSEALHSNAKLFKWKLFGLLSNFVQ